VEGVDRRPFILHVMAKCCRRSTTSDDDALDLTLVQALERSVKIAFRAPRLGSSGCFSVPSGRPKLMFSVSVVGGPHSDLYGARAELLEGVNAGAKVQHEVTNLQPETEYTISVTLDSALTRLLEVAESIDVRTADTSTALLAGDVLGFESWGVNDKEQPHFAKGADEKGCNGLDKSKDGSAKPVAAGQTRQSSAAAVVNASSAAAAAGCDDASTIAPSEGPETQVLARFDDLSDSDCESGVPPAPLAEADACVPAGSACPAEETQQPLESEMPHTPSPILEDVDVIVEDADDSTVREKAFMNMPVCNLCTMLDCLKQQGVSEEETELLIENSRGAARLRQARALAAKAKANPTAGRRPYRIPFPGTAVDPASVGIVGPRQREGDAASHQAGRS